MGGGGDYKPDVPAAPTVTSGIEEYIKNYPELMKLQGEYDPIQAANALKLTEQYALPFGQAIRSAQEGLYPQTSALQESLAGQAAEGMQGGVPEWMRQQYLDEMRANLGTNAGSPIGADYTSRGLINQAEQYRNYYQNLGLSVTGRQPLTAASTPQTNNITGSFTPQNVLGYNASTYSPYVGAYASMYSANQQAEAANSPWNYLMGAGNMLSGFGSFFW